MSVFSWRVPISAPTPTRALIAPPPLPTWQRLAFTMQLQQQPKWCWAAVATSVALHSKSFPNWTQCQVAGRTLGQNCCGPAAVNPCNKAFYLDRALQAVGHFAGMSTGPVGIGALGAQLTTNRPVGARIQWSGGGGHFLAFAGLLLGSQPYIGVADPLYGASDVALSVLGGRYQGIGTWNATYLVR